MKVSNRGRNTVWDEERGQMSQRLHVCAEVEVDVHRTNEGILAILEISLAHLNR